MSFYAKGGKRAIDLVVSSVAVLALAPLFCILAIIVRSDLGSPVLFRQERPGRQAKPFTLLKFRTMHEATRSDGNPVSDADRLTPLGTRLRSWSLDELPSLINVARGEMSLVGPRPLLLDYLQLYSERQSARHQVRPGLTGWAQINGRNNVDWPERLEMDAWYIENVSFSLDLRILWRTLSTVMRRDGISADGEATMRPFTGNQHSDLL